MKASPETLQSINEFLTNFLSEAQQAEVQANKILLGEQISNSKLISALDEYHQTMMLALKEDNFFIALCLCQVAVEYLFDSIHKIYGFEKVVYIELAKGFYLQANGEVVENIPSDKDLVLSLERLQIARDNQIVLS